MSRAHKIDTDNYASALRLSVGPTLLVLYVLVYFIVVNKFWVVTRPYYFGSRMLSACLFSLSYIERLLIFMTQNLYK